LIKSLKCSGYLLVILLFSINAFANNKTVRIVGAKGDAAYSAFANIVRNIDKNIQLVDTKGTVSNIELLNKKETEFAIVQNDIAYYSYYGKNGFEKNKSFLALLPLFPEYIQLIVRKDSSIKINE